jgi:hypothetical protein
MSADNGIKTHARPRNLGESTYSQQYRNGLTAYMANDWTIETMRIVNELTPDIHGRAFDPDWFLLRQRFEQMEEKYSEMLELLETIENDTKLVPNWLWVRIQSAVKRAKEPGK